uniref:W.suaveolens mitochondrial ATP9 gene n=1 Tax=Cyberlindnera suaveolens TaxID=907738 RepID=Q36232_9ASCO|nr:unnamed protein product [Cyberlindnera suaveolens]
MKYINMYNLENNTHELISLMVNKTWYTNNTKQLLYNMIVEQMVLEQPQLLTDEDKYNWLRGFIDAEGNFNINLRLDNKYPRCEFMFAMNLHHEDMKTLNKVLNYLNIKNTLYENKDIIGFKVSNKETITNKVMPMLKKYPFLTKKNYDFETYCQAHDTHNNMTPRNMKYNLTMLNKIKPLKELTNKYNDMDKFPSLEFTNNHMNNYWMVGFIEGDGSFHINNNLLLGFKLGQRKESINALMSTINYIKNQPLENNCSINIKDINPIYLDGKTKAQMSMGYNDFLYWQLMPYLLKFKFQSRKGYDLTIWILFVIIKQHGLHKYSLFQELFNYIKNNHNSKRYNKLTYPSIYKFEEMFNCSDIYDKQLTQDQNARKHRNKIY